MMANSTYVSWYPMDGGCAVKCITNQMSLRRKGIKCNMEARDLKYFLLVDPKKLKLDMDISLGIVETDDRGRVMLYVHDPIIGETYHTVEDGVIVEVTYAGEFTENLRLMDKRRMAMVGAADGLTAAIDDLSIK